MPKPITIVLAVLLGLASGSARAACNSTGTGTEPDGGSNGVDLRLSVTTDMFLGTFARPGNPRLGTGVAQTVVLRPDGTRTVPPTMIIPGDASNPARTPRAAVVDVTGGANCGFEIVIGTASSGLGLVSLEGVAPNAFPSVTSTLARGRLDATGRFRFRVGVSQVVNPTLSTGVGGTIQLIANYRNAP